MQTLIKVSNRAKWYFVKLTSPLTSFKNWFLADIKQTFAELNNNLDNRVENLERVSDLGDIERRLEDLEYYDLYDIQERAENAERKAEDNDTWIESIKERSETNQESIKILKDKLEEFHTNYKKMTGDLGTSLLSDFKIVNERLDNLEELAKKYLNAELQSVVSKQEKTEQSLSDMQRLAFEICHYYGGQFDINDFDNCYEIISKYDVVWKRNPQPKKTKKQGGK